MAKVRKYMITAGEGVDPKRRRTVKVFLKKSDAQAYLKKLLAPAKGNRTAYRDALSGVGIVNPRIKSYMGYA